MKKQSSGAAMGWQYPLLMQLQTVSCFFVPPLEFFVLNHLRMICSESSNQPYKIGLNFCESISLTFRRFCQNIIFFAQHLGLFVRANTRVSADFYGVAR